MLRKDAHYAQGKIAAAAAALRRESLASQILKQLCPARKAGLNPPEPESKFHPLVCAKQVFRVRRRAPAIVPGNPHLHQRSADNGVVYLRKLVGMPCIFHFMGRPGQCGEIHLIPFKEEPAAFPVGDFRPADPCLIAGFLGHNVICHIFMD